MSSLTGESSKSSGCRFKGKRNRSTIDKIKHLSTDYDSPNQQLLTIKDVLKDPVFSKESDQSDMINIDIKLPSIVDLLKKLKQRKGDLGESNINTRRRIQTRS